MTRQRSDSSSTQILTDHEEIRRWAEARKARPSRVKGTAGDDDAGLLRLDFPGYSGEGSLEPISWEEFFEKFEEKKLALLVQIGRESLFNKLVKRDSSRELAA